MKNSSFLLLFAAVAAVGGYFVYERYANPAPAGDGPRFETSKELAMLKAEREKKPVVLIFSATWCGPCRSMKKSVYPSSAVAPFHDKFVWAYLDVDDPSHQRAAKEAGVEGIPHIVVQAPDGRTLFKQVGGSDAATFARGLASALVGGR